MADMPLRELLARYRVAADRVEQAPPDAPVTGEYAFAVFNSAANLLTHVVRTRAGATTAQRAASDAARDAATRVRDDTPVREQWPAVSSFFIRARAAVDALREP